MTSAIQIKPVHFSDNSSNQCQVEKEIAHHPRGVSNGSAVERKSRTAILLIHGIYGDGDTFGCLPHFLAADYPNFDVFIIEYWSNRFLPNFQRLYDLGTTLQAKLAGFSDYDELVIIAHSMGGLIARDAILKERTRLEVQQTGSSSAFLNHLSLVQIGTPNRGSLFAEVEALIKSIPTLPLYIGVNGSFPPHAIIYDRELFDMSLDSTPLLNMVESSSSFIRHLTLRWLEAFGPGSVTRPNVHLIMGLKDKASSDGVVTALNQLSINTMEKNQYCIDGPSDYARHWNGIAKVGSRDHETFKLLRDIFAGKRENSQRCPLKFGSTSVLLTPWGGTWFPIEVNHDSFGTWLRDYLLNWVGLYKILYGPFNVLMAISPETWENGFVDDPYQPRLPPYRFEGRLNLKKGETINIEISRLGKWLSQKHYYLKFAANDTSKSCLATIEENQKDGRILFNLGVGVVNYVLLEAVGEDQIKLTLMGCKEELPPHVDKIVSGK